MKKMIVRFCTEVGMFKGGTLYVDQGYGAMDLGLPGDALVAVTPSIAKRLTAFFEVPEEYMPRGINYTDLEEVKDGEGIRPDHTNGD